MSVSPSARLVLTVVALIFCLHIFAVFQEWYLNSALWWIDIVLHIAGGAWVALAFFYFQRRHVLLFSALPFAFAFLLVIGVVMFVGVVWEWVEYGFDYFFVGDSYAWRAQLGLPDTMGDLAADLIGGSAVGIYFLSRKRHPV